MMVPINAYRQSEAEYALRAEMRKAGRKFRILSVVIEQGNPLGNPRPFADVAIEVTKSSDGMPVRRELLRTYLIDIELLETVRS